MNLQNKKTHPIIPQLISLLIVMLVMLHHITADAQQIHLQAATSAGGTATGTGGSASFALGQVFFKKDSGSDAQISQGVIQILQNPSDPLPITLMSFIAEYIPEDHVVMLTWITSSEIGNDYFTIERSSDAQEFREIETVQGAGYSNKTLLYQWTDHEPLPGISYYRLRQTDFDGTFDFSPIVAVQINETLPELFVYPNPTTQYIHIRIDNPNQLKNSWQLLNLNGRIINQGSFHSEHETLFLTDLPTGAWLLRITRDDYVTTLRIIKK